MDVSFLRSPQRSHELQTYQHNKTAHVVTVQIALGNRAEKQDKNRLSVNSLARLEDHRCPVNGAMTPRVPMGQPLLTVCVLFYFLVAAKPAWCRRSGHSTGPPEPEMSPTLEFDLGLLRRHTTSFCHLLASATLGATANPRFAANSSSFQVAT
jgi:hypothetical protein